MKKIPRLFRNFYVVTSLCFILWMTFFDSNDWINRYRMGSKLRSLEDERDYYSEKIKEVEKDHEGLLGTDESLEKFAREKYLMRKPGEDVFVIETTK